MKIKPQHIAIAALGAFLLWKKRSAAVGGIDEDISNIVILAEFKADEYLSIHNPKSRDIAKVKVIMADYNFKNATYSEWQEIKSDIEQLPTTYLALLAKYRAKNIGFIAAKEFLRRIK